MVFSLIGSPPCIFDFLQENNGGHGKRSRFAEETVDKEYDRVPDAGIPKKRRTSDDGCFFDRNFLGIYPFFYCLVCL